MGQYKEITMRDAHLTHGFWADRQRISRENSLWGIYDRFAETGRFGAIDCLWKEGMPLKPHIFWDSDIAKWIESAAYLLMEKRDEKMESVIDDIVERYAAHQWEDGYINSYFTTVEPDKRFTDYTMHELYCLGHLLEAAVAYAQATGKERLLEILLKYVELVDRVFRVEHSAAFDTPGHEEIELALYKVWKYTGDEKYLTLMRYFINTRGTSKKDKTYDVFGDNAYSQAHVPVREQTTCEGHSVRAMYLYSAMADLAEHDGDAGLKKACETLFDNCVNRRMYVTGGIGSSHVGEAFTMDYDMRNRTAYTETCASIGLAMFARRMSLVEPKGIYGDIAELALYNGMLSGISLDGVSYFYENPLEVQPTIHHINDKWKIAREHETAIRRKRVFDCSCCPPNILRVIASAADYIATESSDTLYIHQYMASEINTAFGAFAMQTDYPYEGKITLAAKTEGKFAVALRIPQWSECYTLNVNGEDAGETLTDGYAVISREWKNGDKIELELDMRVKCVYANPALHEDCGRVAVKRGPLVYCLEEPDNGKLLKDIAIWRDQEFATGWDDKLGVPVIDADAVKTEWPEGVLYSTVPGKQIACRVRFIPFYAWANREEGEMLVWVQVKA